MLKIGSNLVRVMFYATLHISTFPFFSEDFFDHPYLKERSKPMPSPAAAGVASDRQPIAASPVSSLPRLVGATPMASSPIAAPIPSSSPAIHVRTPSESPVPTTTPTNPIATATVTVISPKPTASVARNTAPGAECENDFIIVQSPGQDPSKMPR